MELLKKIPTQYWKFLACYLEKYIEHLQFILELWKDTEIQQWKKTPKSDTRTWPIASSQLCHSIVMWFWANKLISLCLDFLICEMRMFGVKWISNSPFSFNSLFASIVTKYHIRKCFMRSQMAQCYSALIPGMYPAVSNEAHWTFEDSDECLRSCGISVPYCVRDNWWLNQLYVCAKSKPQSSVGAMFIRHL